MWNSVPSSTAQFRWYAGQTSTATLSGTGDLSATGALTTGGASVQTQPYVAFRLDNLASTAVNPGQVASGSVTLRAGRVANAIYTFTFTTAHPSGTNYMVMATPNKPSSSTPLYTCTTKVESSTSFSVWCRKADNTFVDGDFFCIHHTLNSFHLIDVALRQSKELTTAY